jgi:hypothetical protein
MSRFRHSVVFDETRNVVHVTQAGYAQAEDMMRLGRDYAAVLARTRPGFVLVNDQLEVESFSDAALEVGKELIALTDAHGVGKVIRIAPPGLIPRTRISRALVSADPSYASVRVSTREQAQRALAEHLAAPQGQG